MSGRHVPETAGQTRRAVLRGGAGALGAAALAGAGGVVASGPAAAAGGGTASAAALSSRGGCPMHGNGYTTSTVFSRMFHLAPFAESTPTVRGALLDIGRPGGMLDANDDLFGPNGGPVKLITDPTLSLVNQNNPRNSAGLTFWGQFIDHDLTFDAVSSLGVATEPTHLPNGRSPRFDLDSVYGAGPVLSHDLYDPAAPTKFLVEDGGQFEDLPRRADNSAIVGDLRNDSNLMISGLHAAFLKFHNNAIDDLAGSGLDPFAAFQLARRETTWHYQWLVVNRILPQFVGADLVLQLLRHGNRHFHPGSLASIPVEYAGAAYRFGHSLVRPSYRANLAGDNGRPFFGLIFDSRVQVPDGENPVSDPGDLRGGVRAPRRFVGWQTFFDFGGAYTSAVRTTKIIDTILSTPLFALPTSAIAHLKGTPGPTSLPQRTLLRHLTYGLPSGQAIAQAMRLPLLSCGDLADFRMPGTSLDRHTPLWLYVLREAKLVHAGQYLGPLGGRIVAEVMLGLLTADPTSYLSVQPSWTPHLTGTGGARGAGYTVADFFRFAGVDPVSRGQ